MTDNAIRDDCQTSLLVRMMAQKCVRNTALEDIHAGTGPVTRTGDYSDVTVVDAEGRRIPWPEVSHFGDDDMRALMREIVDKLYTFMLHSREPGFLERVGIWMLSARRWDEPKIVEPFLPGFASSLNYTVAPLFGTDMVTEDLETGYMLAQTLNGRLGLDAAACQMFAEQVMAANPTGRHPQDRPVGPG